MTTDVSRAFLPQADAVSTMRSFATTLEVPRSPPVAGAGVEAGKSRNERVNHFNLGLAR